MFVLPQILLIGSGVVDRTSFSVPGPWAVGGRKTGQRHAPPSTAWCPGQHQRHDPGRGTRGTVEGDIDLNLVSGSAANDEEA